MSNSEIAQAFRDVYNGWWLRWRRRVIGRHDPAWDTVVQEAGEIMDKYYHAPLVVHLVVDLLDELEERSKKEEKHD